MAALEPPGQVVGTAGASLQRGAKTWAANDDVVRVGRTGELLTAVRLGDLAARPGGPSVVHDLSMPGTNANIDHAVVSGRTVTIIDSKTWEPGTYFALFGRVFRGGRRAKHADKAAVAWQRARAAKVVGAAGTVARPVVVVWPSNESRPINVRWLRLRGVKIVAGPSLTMGRLARLTGSRSADVSTFRAVVAMRPTADTPTPTLRETDLPPQGDELPATDQLI